ncbi:hypothetical protein RRG08_040506 [Elysia crispata]|uniref:alanine transaminase n=1 Tax=Elysia crispata TaxID=231223 RepID=A0AAE1D9Z7_9GAST|nr:hypothetical protein RRG08_040506 [Elysia crispata]
MGSEGDSNVLTMGTLNPNVIEIRFGLESPVFGRFNDLVNEIESGVEKPFTKIINLSVGDTHKLGLKPITFLRQVLALCAYPELLKSGDFPEDVKARAEKILKACGKGIGSYTDPWGLKEVREDVARYIAERDGYPSDYRDIGLTSGAAGAARQVMSLLMTGKDTVKRTGLMIPVPQYPLYSATTSEFGGYTIPYYLEEGTNWSLDIMELERAIAEAKPHCIPRAIVVINPGNPTSSVLTKDEIKEIIKFAHRHRLFLMADEVYQHNVWADGAEFVSFKKTLMEMGPPYTQMQLASFMSASKGFMGECGLRAGYFEIINIPPDVKAEITKSLFVKQCAPSTGQAVMDCVVNPPKPGDASYNQFIQEKTFVISDLKKKSKVVSDFLNSVEGITCPEISGSMYAFARIHLSEKALQAAEKAGLIPDDFYCISLLEQTGIFTVPGYCFRQKPGTFHFRMTILPQMEDLLYALEKLKEFQTNFMAKYE